jgi:1,4-alpha-glucan branching enzyme
MKYWAVLTADPILTALMKPQLLQNNHHKSDRVWIQFAFPARTARQVAVAGDFNHWNTQADRMRKGADGVWRLSLPLNPGRYEYRFFADEVWCDDPAARERVSNSMGTENCVRTV